MKNYILRKQIERSGEETFILERPDGTKTSALTKSEVCAILFYPRMSEVVVNLLGKVAEIVPSSIMFGNEVVALINQPLENNYHQNYEIMMQMENSDDSIQIPC